jgi:hypothetical protein
VPVVVAEVGGCGGGGEAEEEVGEGADDVLVRAPVVEREVAEQQLVEARPVAAAPRVQPQRRGHLLHGPEEVGVRVRRVRGHRHPGRAHAHAQGGGAAAVRRRVDDGVGAARGREEEPARRDGRGQPGLGQRRRVLAHRAAAVVLVVLAARRGRPRARRGGARRRGRRRGRVVGRRRHGLRRRCRRPPQPREASQHRPCSL